MPHIGAKKAKPKETYKNFYNVEQHVVGIVQEIANSQADTESEHLSGLQRAERKP